MSTLYENYHKVSSIPKKIISENNFTYRNIIRVIKKYNKGKRVLDIGSGVGTLDFYLASKGKSVTGIELSKGAVEVANKSARALNLRKSTKFIRGNFLKETLKDKYDLVICSEVLEHLTDDSGALRKISNLVQKEGFIILTVPSVNAPLYKMGLADKFDKRVGHKRRYSYRELKRLVENNGFKVIYKDNREGIIRNSLFIFTFGKYVVRIANKSKIFSALIELIDNITIPLFGGSNIYFVIREK